MSIKRFIENGEPGVTWRHLCTGTHEARGGQFFLHVCRINEGGQLRLYVFKDAEFVSYIFDPQHDVSCAVGSEAEAALVSDLISSAKHSIDQNEHEMY